MSLARWEPFQEWSRFPQHLAPFFDLHPVFPSFTGPTPYMPRLDVYQTDAEVVAKCELPGLDSHDDVELHSSLDNLGQGRNLRVRKHQG